jgi:acyl-CoA thioesterase
MSSAAQRLGIKVEAVRPGYARLTMTVNADMVNGLDVGHGGMTFALADTAMAYASSSYNLVAFVQNAQINFLAPTRRGETLTAEATEQSRIGRAAIYDVAVKNPAGTTVALFRGQTIRMNDKVDDAAPVNA